MTTPLASRTDEDGRVEREIRIEARPETVFTFLVDPTRLVRWMGKTAILEPRPGGTFRLDYGQGDIVLGEVTEIDAPHRLTLTWGWDKAGDETPAGSSVVEFSLEPDGEATILRLVHSGLVADAVRSHAEGWEYFLPRLLDAVAAG